MPRLLIISTVLMLAIGCLSQPRCVVTASAAGVLGFPTEETDIGANFRIQGYYRQYFEMSDLVPYFQGSPDNLSGFPEGYCLEIIEACRELFDEVTATDDERFDRQGFIDVVGEYRGERGLGCGPLGLFRVTAIVVPDDEEQPQ
jgi:hypothetical protein